ncbi:MAG TPA: mercuric reductase [Candidatus Obscuribacterales bacterium]
MSYASVEAVTVLPEDAYNQALVEQVHPPNWENPQPAASYNLVVIGGGTAGLVAAAGAAGLGAKVALVEKHLMGGDCLNVGCVPSKCMIRSARVAADFKAAERYGIHVPKDVEVDFSGVMERLRRLRAEISPHDSAQRFQQLGVDVFLGTARFSSANTVEAAGQTLRFKQAVIATGTRPAEPAIPGLAEAGYLTNETVFSLTQRPQRLAVVGGGPIGCELAQTFRRLGSEVVLFHNHSHLLDREDETASEIIQRTFIAEGVQLVLSAQIQRVEVTGAGKVIHYESDGQAGSVIVDEILVGAGRVPNVEGLDLERVGVKYDQHQGVWVNDRLQTTNARIYAAGDVCMDWKFTHAADAAARIVIQNALFLGRKKLSSLTMPWVTYTDPEIAHVGLYEQQAQAQGIKLDTYLVPLEEVDRAIADGETAGFAKVHVKQGTDKIVGATIVARHAGEMISEVTLAMVGNLGLKTIATTIHPYPTQAEVIRKVADAYNRTRLTPTVKKLFSTWLAWRR